MSYFYFKNPADEMPEIDRDPWKDSVPVFNRPIDPAPGEYPSPRKKCKILISLNCFLIIYIYYNNLMETFISTWSLFLVKGLKDQAISKDSGINDLFKQ